eukprot:366258-Chlamydomonas_euryale.AAC.19
MALFTSGVGAAIHTSVTSQPTEIMLLGVRWCASCLSVPLHPTLIGLLTVLRLASRYPRASSRLSHTKSEMQSLAWAAVQLVCLPRLSPPLSWNMIPGKTPRTLKRQPQQCSTRVVHEESCMQSRQPGPSPGPLIPCAPHLVSYVGALVAAAQPSREHTQEQQHSSSTAPLMCCQLCRRCGNQLKASRTSLHIQHSIASQAALRRSRCT